MYVGVSICGYMYLISDTLRDQKKALNPMEQKLQADVSGLMAYLFYHLWQQYNCTINNVYYFSKLIQG